MGIPADEAPVKTNGNTRVVSAPPDHNPAGPPSSGKKPTSTRTSKAAEVIATAAIPTNGKRMQVIPAPNIPTTEINNSTSMKTVNTRMTIANQRTTSGSRLAEHGSSDTNDNSQPQGIPATDATGNGANDTSPAPEPDTDTSMPLPIPLANEWPASDQPLESGYTTLGSPDSTETTVATSMDAQRASTPSVGNKTLGNPADETGNDVDRPPSAGPPNRVPGTTYPASNNAPNDPLKRRSNHHVHWASPLTEKRLIEVALQDANTPQPRSQKLELHPSTVRTTEARTVETPFHGPT